MSRREDVRIVVECDRCGDQINHCYDCGASYFMPTDRIDVDVHDGADLCEQCYREVTCTEHRWKMDGSSLAYCTTCRLEADVVIPPRPEPGNAS